MARVTLFTSSKDKPQSIPPSSSSASFSPSGLAKPSSSRADPDSDDESSDATEEVDELDSNDEIQPQSPAKPSKAQASTAKPPSVSTASAPAGGAVAAGGDSQASEPPPKPRKQKQKRGKPITTRQPGTSLVPVNKVESIVASDPQNGIVTKEAIYIIALATEEFIRHITRVSHSRSTYDKRFLTTLNDFADTAFYFEEYKFLQDMIPRPVSLSFAVEERKRIVAKREALLAGADAPPPPPTFPSARASAAGFRKKSKGKASASTNGRSASAASKRSVSGATDVSNIRSERVRRRSMLGQSQDMDVEAKQERSSPAIPDLEGHSQPADKEVPAPENGLMKIKIKARSSATPGASTPTSASAREEPVEVLALDTAARLASTKPPGPVLELGPRLEAEVFVHESGDAAARRKALSETSKSEDGSLERKMEDARIDGERSRSGSEPELEPRNSRKRPPSTSMSESPIAAPIGPRRTSTPNGKMPPPPTPMDAEHLAKRRKKADGEISPKTSYPDANAVSALKEKANGHSFTPEKARPATSGAGEETNGLLRQPHQDFRGGAGRTIYSARKPV